MTPSDATKLLTYIAAINHRTVSENDATVWADLLNDVHLDDALEAARNHFRNRPGVYLDPGFILEEVRRIRNLRIERAGAFPAPPPEVAAYKKTMQALIGMAANGLALPKNLLTPANETPGIEGERLKTLHTMRNTRYSVPCPWPPCHASVGDPCRNPAGMTLPNPHPSRADLARETHHDA